MKHLRLMAGQIDQAVRIGGLPDLRGLSRFSRQRKWRLSPLTLGTRPSIAAPPRAVPSAPEAISPRASVPADHSRAVGSGCGRSRRPAPARRSNGGSTSAERSSVAPASRRDRFALVSGSLAETFATQQIPRYSRPHRATYLPLSSTRRYAARRVSALSSAPPNERFSSR